MKCAHFTDQQEEMVYWPKIEHDAMQCLIYIKGLLRTQMRLPTYFSRVPLKRSK